MSAYDVVVLGAGPGGYVAALRAAQLGAKVCLIEKNVVGGTCLNRGCIPSKALIHSAALWKRAKEGGAFGVTASQWLFDWGKAQSRKNDIVSTQVKGVHTLLQAAKVEVKQGAGSLVDARTVRVSTNGATETVTRKAIIIATYSLCGFANFSSIAIQIGGISPLAENRRSDIAKFGLKAVLGGTIATWMTASIAGILA